MTYSIALVGNPNCGKTTLFNALTGARQKVGNWPGVTVERKQGIMQCAGQEIEVTDIPGVYSLTSFAEVAKDEAIALNFITENACDLIVNIIDASNLERNLYLTSQLLEMKIPVLVALNMMDVAKARHLDIDIAQLSQELGCPVVILQANRSKGIDELQQTISKRLPKPGQNKPLAMYPEAVATILDELPAHYDKAHALRYFEGDFAIKQHIDSDFQHLLGTCQKRLETVLDDDLDVVLADARYTTIHAICKRSVQTRKPGTMTISQRLDKWLIHRVFGLPIFFAIMYTMFLFAINVGGAFQDFFDLASQAIFVDGLASLGHTLGLPVALTAILATGIGKGINTTLTFIPIIGAMYFFLAFLERSGYMARAAFVMDRVMRALGLPGKAFVPLIVGFGCNVPSIMAARTLENPRDRILTILMAPFMSCGARLAIYAVFTAAFFPVGGQNVVFVLYITGILMAVLTGLLLRKTLLKGAPAPFILELPAYHMPTLGGLLIAMWQRLKGFVLRAGRYIIPVCMLIGALNAISLDGHLSLGDANQDTLLSYIGKSLTPLFAPMGIHNDNWPATVGLLTGTLAKEVVVATLNTLYMQVGHLASHQDGTFHLLGSLREAVLTIPANLKALPETLGNPILASMPDNTVNPGVYGIMASRFAGKASAFAYLLFVLLYIPCVSTMAVTARELNRKWAVFSLSWSLLLAYSVAVIFYQLATASSHVLSSIVTSAVMLGVVSTVILSLKRFPVARAV